MLRSRARPTAILAVLAALAVSLLGACGNAAPGPEAGASGPGQIAVVTSTNVYASIVSAVGGDRVGVHALVSNAAADPHSYEATAQDKLALSKAQLGVENGGGYDDFFDQVAHGVLDPGKILKVADVSGLDSSAPGFNEHIWYSLPAMARTADELAKRLGALDAASAADFTRNAATFTSSLAGLEKRLATLRAAHAGQAVAVTEPVPLYLLQEAGLVNKTPAKFTEAVEEGSDVPPAVVKTTTDLLAGGRVRLLAYNAQTAGPQTEAVRKAAEAAGVPVVDFTETLPEGLTYLTWMDANVRALEKALGS